jgi:broad specificity polyphosphatase/5'/3'-nucleotidase SurE
MAAYSPNKRDYCPNKREKEKSYKARLAFNFPSLTPSELTLEVNKSLNILAEQSNTESLSTTQLDSSYLTATAGCSNINLPRSSKKRKIEDKSSVEWKKKNISIEGNVDESELKGNVKFEKNNEESEEEEEDGEYRKKTRKSVTEWTEKEVIDLGFLIIIK